MYAKIRLYNDRRGTIHSVAVKSWGANDSEVVTNVKNMVENWQELTSFSILKVSTQQIFIEKYCTEVVLFYSNRNSRTVKLNLTAETQTEAEEIAKEILSGWNMVKDYRIKSTNLRR